MTAPWWMDWHRRTLAVLDASPWLRRTSWGTRPEEHIHRTYDGNVCNAFGVDGREDDMDLQASGMPRESAPWAYRHVPTSGLSWCSDIPYVGIYEHGRTRFLAPAPFARVWGLWLPERRHSDWSRAYIHHTRDMSVAELAAFEVHVRRVAVINRLTSSWGATENAAGEMLRALGLPTVLEAMR